MPRGARGREAESVFRYRLTWLATVVTTALLAVMLLNVGGIAAKTPGWGFNPSSITGDPATVSPGAYVSYSFAVENTGKSNISAVFLTTDIPLGSGLETPVWVFPAVWTNQDGPTAPCGSAPFDGPLNCDLGNIVAGGSVHLQIVFQAPDTGTSWKFNFLLYGNGNTPSDSGGTSHGDYKKGPASVSISSSAEFAGGFTLDGGGTFGTTGALSKRNPQSSSVTTPQSFAATTIEDFSSYPLGGTDPCSLSGANCIGQWTRVSAPNPDGGALKFEFEIYGKGIPGSVSADDILLYHYADNGTLIEIVGDIPEERCDPATADTDPSHVPCIYVTESGGNFHVVAWLKNNGGLKFTY
jgi:uncharacterized repeat protein (TIGR01451 family)